MLTRTIFVVVLFAVLKCCHAQPLPVISVVSPNGVFDTEWSLRVVSNGGVRPSQATITASYNFLVGLTNDSIDSKIFYINFIAPDSLAAALTPLIYNSADNYHLTANYPASNAGSFVLGDLTVNGLKGDKTAKYFKSGTSCTNFTTTSSGITLYVTEGGTAAFIQTGAQEQISSTRFELFGVPNVAQFCAQNFTEGQGQITSTATSGLGYYSGNRTAANAFGIYFANSGTAHLSLTNGTTTGGASTPNQELFVFCLNVVNPVPVATFFVDSRLGFVAYHRGFTSAESLKFYNRIQTLMTAVGRAQ